MKRILFLSIAVLLVLSDSVWTQSNKKMQKVLVAVPYFNLEGDINASYGKVCAASLMSAFDKSGRIETKSENDVKLMMEQAAKEQGTGTCNDDACMKKLGQKMQVDYIADSMISKTKDSYYITVRLVTIRGERDIATIMKKVSKEKDIEPTVKLIGEELALSFPLEGVVLSVDTDEDTVIINLGSSNNLQKGDAFDVKREKKVAGTDYKERKEIGRIILIDVQSNSSKAEIDEGKSKNFAVGDIVTLDQKEEMKKIDKRRKEEQKRLEEEQKKLEEEEAERQEKLDEERERQQDEADARKSDQEWSKWESKLSGRSPLFRLGYGYPGFVHMADEDLDKYYGSGAMYVFDWIPSSYRDSSGDGMDIFYRFTYKTFEMTDDGLADLIADTGTAGAEASEMTMMAFDVGFRVAYGFILLERFDLYMLGSFRYQATEEEGLETYSFSSYGLIAGGGIEMTIIPQLGVFAEYNYGYHTIGENNPRNVDGHQIFFGITIRTENTSY